MRLFIPQNLGNPSSFSCSLAVVLYAIYCVGQEGFYTSLKPEEALIYLYDGRMVGMMSRTGYGKSSCFLWCFELLLAKTTRPYDHRRGR